VILPSDFVLLGKSLATVGGVALMLDPDCSPIEIISPKLRPLTEVRPDPLPDHLQRRLERLNEEIRDQLGMLAARGLEGEEIPPESTVEGLGGHRFFPITPTADAERHMEAIRQDCEDRATGGVAAALWSRAYEQVLRVAGVVAFGHAVIDDNLTAPMITEDMLLWARDFVYWCLEELVPEAEEHASDGERDRLQRGIIRSLTKLAYAVGPDRWVRKTDLLNQVKGRGRNYSDLKSEIQALIECGDIEVEKDEEGKPARPERLRLRQRTGD